MFISNFLLSTLLFVPCRDSFLTRWSRSEMTRAKERCGQSLLLNNHFWLFQQTLRALQAIEANEFSFNELPWPRLQRAVRQIYNSCSIDRNAYVKERRHRQQTLLKTGTYLAEKVKGVSQPSLIAFANDWSPLASSHLLISRKATKLSSRSRLTPKWISFGDLQFRTLPFTSCELLFSTASNSLNTNTSFVAAEQCVNW